MLREWWCKVRRSLAGRRGLADDLSAEIEAQLAFETDENIARGMPPDEARAAARRRIGNLTQIQQRATEAWAFPKLETIAQDLRYGWRGMRRSPGFSTIVILTLALGIGANTAIFSVVNAVLLRPLPYPAAERLVQLSESDPKAEGISVTWVNYQHWRAGNHSFEDMAGFHTAHLTLTGRGQAQLLRAAIVTSAFFPLTGAKPLLGRVFGDADDRPGAPLAAVVSYPFWLDKLGADAHIPGATLTLNGQPCVVLGVLPPHYGFFERPIDLYLPLHRMQGDIADRASHGSMRVLARLKPGFTLASATADLNSIMRRLAEVDPGPESQHRATGLFLAESMTGDVRPMLLILLASAGLVLMIACANVASLVLARSTARAREIAIRAAIGAGRTRLVRQLLTENMLLAGLGGMAGCLLAQWGSQALIAAAPPGIPRLAEATFEWRVLLFAAAITIFTGLFTGLAPVITARTAELVSALKDSSRTATARGGQRSRSALVVSEIALTLVLAFAAGLLLRNLIAAQTGDPGYDPEHVLALELVMHPSGNPSAEADRSFYVRLKDGLGALPGVTGVGGVNCPPAAGDCGDWFYSVLDRAAPPPGEVPITLFNSADGDYFHALRIPLRQGRAFTAHDPPDVVVVNETFARKWWRGRSAVGGRIKWGGPYRAGRVYEIIGVVGDVSQMGPGTEPYPEVYLPLSQWTSEGVVLMIRSRRDPRELAAAVRRRVTLIDRNLPIQSLQPFTESVAASLAQRRFSALLLALFAALAMALAAVGIYGLLNYWVRVRQAEIAIRMALGAPRSAILGWGAWQALRLSLTGVAIGCLGSWAVTRWLGSLVSGVPADGFTTLLAAAAAVIAIVAVAAALPVWRATQIDPVGWLHRA